MGVALLCRSILVGIKENLFSRVSISECIILDFKGQDQVFLPFE